ncbi:DUF6950 family protein [Pantoea ananatis]
MMKKRERIKYLLGHVEEVLSKPYELGTNDCNIIVVKAVDILCDTQYTEKAYGKYSTVKDGLKIFKQNGFEDLEELVATHGSLTEFPIIGDIMIDNLNASIVLNDVVLVVNHQTKQFEVKRLSDFMDKVFYRIG